MLNARALPIRRTSIAAALSWAFFAPRAVAQEATPSGVAASAQPSAVELFVGAPRPEYRVEVIAALHRLRDPWTKCFESSAATHSALGGRIDLELEVDEGGAVTRVKANTSSGNLAAIAPCLEAEARLARFSKGEAFGTRVSLMLSEAHAAVAPTREGDGPKDRSEETTQTSRASTNSSARARPLGRSFGPRLRFDVNLEGALGALAADGHVTGFGRARVGWLYSHESLVDPEASPVFITAGLTYDVGDLSPASLGLQAEVIHVASGFWLQAGGLVDVTRGEPGIMSAAGWSVVGAEVQWRRYEHDDGHMGSGLVALGKLRVPLTLILDAL